jgi:hypothetical protein
MRGDNGERWRVLCEQAAVEQDHDRLIALINEMSRLLDEKEARFNASRVAKRREDAPAMTKQGQLTGNPTFGR